ncbi:MAG: TraR/DksA C4-type zinc finger protein [Sporocytophaga sp.]|uniref:TraR/DksA C4-type zinc finger protein n=1 Tax=Sporocytophaga sp. TaxID=2231183 RepID=UPI001B2C8E13|nr:TraR/DksA C4-type zinc finger protein [Sporocytophaga sp.]
MQCIKCQKTIPDLRLKALPNAKTCLDCSETARVAGFPIVSGKTTYSELQIVSTEKAEELYQKQNRTGGVSEGVTFKDNSIPKLSNLE